MEFYRMTDYRQCLRWAMERLAVRGEKISAAQLAASMGVQSPYLSKVFSHQAHLSDDQLYLASEALQLSTEEYRYLHLLLAYARASLKKRQDQLLHEIREVQNRKLSPSEHREAGTIHQETDAHSSYYLDPWSQIIHMYLTIPKWRRQPQLLAAKTGLRPDRLALILKTLEDLKIIEIKNNSVQLLLDQLHLPKSSPLCSPQQTLMKTLALQRTQNLDENYSFSACFSANESARVEIRHLFTDFLKKVEKVVKAAPSEEVYQLQFDLFPWSDPEGS